MRLKRSDFPTAEEVKARLKADGITSSKRYTAARREGKYQEFPALLPNAYGKPYTWFFDSIAYKDKLFPTAEEFKGRLKADGVSSQPHYRAARKEGKYRELPSNPHKVYGKPWAWFFDSIVNRDKTFPTAEEFKGRLKADGISSQDQYKDARREEKYREFPSAPDEVYGKSWTWFFDSIASKDKTFPTAEEFKGRLQADGITSNLQYKDARREGKYREFPSNPHNVYGKPWAWFVGSKASWTRNSFSRYIQELFSHQTQHDLTELYFILSEAGAMPAVMRITQAATHVAAIRQLQTLAAAEIETAVQGLSNDDLAEGDGELDMLPGDNLEDEDAPLTVAELRAVDIPMLTPDAVSMMIDRRINKLWQLTIRDGYDAALALLTDGDGRYFGEMRERFQLEYLEAATLPTPAGWSLTVDGQPAQPNLMQQRVACMVAQQTAVCNFSGTGAGKTLSAILASRVINAGLTVILAANSTLPGWKDAIHGSFASCHVAFDLASLPMAPVNEPWYLVLNYEQFQVAGSDDLADSIIALKPDFIVLDEIQFIKQRKGVAVSNRRTVIHGVVSRLPETRILAMTATPVINDLRELKSLMETALRSEIDLGTRPTQENALQWHHFWQRYGVRFKMANSQQVTVTTPKARRNDLIEELVDADHASEIERALIAPKLDLVADSIVPGTILYTEFLTGIVPVVRERIESLGLTLGEYTGEVGADAREEDKEAFIAGRVDVLLGSSAIKVGVDGLQRRANRLVLLGTPWTSSDWDQLVGRVHRQGSKFDSVEVIHPQVSISTEYGNWSWDAIRLDAVHAKRRLAEAALDGVLMNEEQVSQDDLTRRALAALHELLGIEKERAA
jgi:helicase-like protein